jgi:hypothetical protein
MTLSLRILLRMRNTSNKLVGKIKTCILRSVSPPPRKSRLLWECRKRLWSQRIHRWIYGACALHDAHVKLHTRKHTSVPVHPHPHTRTHELTNARMHTHRDCFTTVTWVPRTRLYDTLYCTYVTALVFSSTRNSPFWQTCENCIFDDSGICICSKHVRALKQISCSFEIPFCVTVLLFSPIVIKFVTNPIFLECVISFVCVHLCFNYFVLVL